MTLNDALHAGRSLQRIDILRIVAQQSPGQLQAPDEPMRHRRPKLAGKERSRRPIERPRIAGEILNVEQLLRIVQLRKLRPEPRVQAVRRPEVRQAARDGHTGAGDEQNAARPPDQAADALDGAADVRQPLAHRRQLRDDRHADAQQPDEQPDEMRIGGGAQQAQQQQIGGGRRAEAPAVRLAVVVRCGFSVIVGFVNICRVVLLFLRFGFSLLSGIALAAMGRLVVVG